MSCTSKFQYTRTSPADETGRKNSKLNGISAATYIDVRVDKEVEGRLFRNSKAIIQS